MRHTTQNPECFSLLRSAMAAKTEYIKEARIQIKGKKYQIGSFETNKEANCAYVAKLDVIAEGKRDAQED